jgi:predicted adenine nucleotide alpha hydrolase (AANH) superfamily ATPase
LKILLHICCGVCAGGVAETLKAEGHEVIGFFHNPNIHPSDEYHRRLVTAQKIARQMGFHIIVPPYKPDSWLRETALLKDEPEGGKRCHTCFKIRLNETFCFLTASGADAFTTTLTISPSKSAEMVNAIGREIGGDKYLTRDFKRKDGFKKTIQLARQWELYRQDYCGCMYSIRQKANPTRI